jgi:hypothetical protein
MLEHPFPLVIKFSIWYGINHKLLITFLEELKMVHQIVDINQIFNK